MIFSRRETYSCSLYGISACRAAAPARTGICRALAALYQKTGPAEEGRDGSWRLRRPGEVRPAGVAPHHAGCITAAPKRKRSPPSARAPGLPRGSRRSRWSRRPINLVVYRPLGAWARGQAPLSEAVRGEVLAQSRALHVGHGQPQVACPRSIIIEFCTASSSSGALDITSLCPPAPGVLGPVAARPRQPAWPRRGRQDVQIGQIASTAPGGPHPLLALPSSLSARDAASRELPRVSPSLIAE